MNKGIEIASGDYYIFLGADDVFYNNTILEEISLIKRHF
jgi:glycosyltransferase involved in cell wall biosynthesis